MQNGKNTIRTQNQNPNKITSVPGRTWLSTITCSNSNGGDSHCIPLTSLESMWYNHEENVNHPAESEYPVSINVPHMKIMRDRVFASIQNRTGIDVGQFDNVIHASSLPALVTVSQ